MNGAYGAWRQLVQLAAKPLGIWRLLPLPLLLLIAAPAMAQPKLVLAFGDSLTAGYQLPPNQGFAPRLEAALRRSGVPATVRNAGVSGDTTQQGRARLGWVLGGLKQNPALVVLELGANDMLRGLPPAVARANLDAILAELKRRRIPVILAGMRASANMGPAYRRDFDGIYPALARRYGVPLYPLFVDGIVGRRELLLADGMHPNARGVDRIVAGIAPMVRRALAR